MAKKNISKQIEKATDGLKKVMQDNLSIIAGNMIDQIMKNYRNATNSQKINSTKGVTQTGQAQYKKELQTGMAIVSSASLDQARSEVPAAENVKLAEWNEERILLGEFEELPPKIKNRLKASSDLLLDTQLADLEKAIFFQFQTSLRNDAGETEIKGDMVEKAEKYITGNSINAGAGVTAANVVNEARTAFFFDDKVLQELDAFQFVNGDPVAQICIELAGIIYSKNDPNAFRYNAPLHYNCKSWTRPILKGNLNKTRGQDGEMGSIQKLEPRTKKGFDSVQFTEIQNACSHDAQSCCHLHL
ncbi:hypothetical protein KAR91_40735 [Candidatus Pacearchaeota archaeon]|nr:hypothetical protein [Candidatus Pacearchaeota archaeon]